MTAAEYLKARGWVPCDPAWLAADSARSETWCDPLRSGSDDGNDGEGQWWLLTHALTIQRARDEAECRAAWVQFAASAYCAGNPAEADAMLAEYRARFCPEVES